MSQIGWFGSILHSRRVPTEHLSVSRSSARYDLDRDGLILPHESLLEVLLHDLWPGTLLGHNMGPVIPAIVRNRCTSVGAVLRWNAS